MFSQSTWVSVYSAVSLGVAVCVCVYFMYAATRKSIPRCKCDEISLLGCSITVTSPTLGVCVSFSLSISPVGVLCVFACLCLDSLGCLSGLSAFYQLFVNMCLNGDRRIDLSNTLSHTSNSSIVRVSLNILWVLKFSAIHSCKTKPSPTSLLVSRRFWRPPMLHSQTIQFRCLSIVFLSHTLTTMCRFQFHQISNASLLSMPHR